MRKGNSKNNGAKKNKNEKAKKGYNIYLRIFVGFLLVVLFGVIPWQFREQFALLSTKLVNNGYDLVSANKMNILKTKGCVYDGLLTSRYNPQFNASLAMLKRSDCQYIHRAVETWNIPPNFSGIKRKIATIKKRTNKDFIYSLFIAESIDVTKSYYDPIQKRKFNFNAMCSPGTYGAWGKNTCKPSIYKMEYRRYLDSIMKRAIDIGIYDFTFGQIYYQDLGWKKNPTLIRSIIANAKQYAKSKGVEISVGAQTNTIDSEEYLRNFDYITGGVGQSRKGKIQKEGACWDYYYKRDEYCWAMMWDDKWKGKANNVLVYLDWNNSASDDIHRFLSMNREARGLFLARAYDSFVWRDVGFLFPLGVVLGNVGAGCYGPTREFYSASNQYSCRDEDAVNNVLSGGNLLPNHAKILSYDVPKIMEAGKKYQVTVNVKNTSFRVWNKNGNIKLGSWDPQDNLVWGVSRAGFADNENMGHNEIKEFIFDVTAPVNVGEYVFNWRMVEDGVGWFGKPGPGVKVEIVPTGSLIDDNQDQKNNDEIGNDILATQIVDESKKKKTSANSKKGDSLTDNIGRTIKRFRKSFSK